MEPIMVASLVALFTAGLGISMPKLLAQGTLVDWAPALVTGIVTVGGFLINRARFDEKVVNHEKRLDTVEGKVDTVTSKVSHLYGHLKIEER